jgi:hypothetical protein
VNSVDLTPQPAQYVTTPVAPPWSNQQQRVSNPPTSWRQGVDRKNSDSLLNSHVEIYYGFSLSCFSRLARSKTRT